MEHVDDVRYFSIFFCVFVFVHFLNVFPDKRTENEIYLCYDERVRGETTRNKKKMITR